MRCSILRFASMLFLFMAATTHHSFGQSVTAKSQLDTPSQPTLALPTSFQTISLGLTSSTSAGALGQGNQCTQRQAEKPVTCSCTDNQGHTSHPQAQCYSCHNPVNGQKCGGPYCQSCPVLCNPAGSVPPQTPGPC